MLKRVFTIIMVVLLSLVMVFGAETHESHSHDLDNANEIIMVNQDDPKEETIDNCCRIAGETVMDMSGHDSCPVNMQNAEAKQSPGHANCPMKMPKEEGNQNHDHGDCPMKAQNSVENHEHDNCPMKSHNAEGKHSHKHEESGERQLASDICSMCKVSACC